MPWGHLQRLPRRAKAATLVVAVFALLGPGGAEGSGSAGKQADEPWKAAEAIRGALFDARTELLLDGASELRSLDDAEAALSGRLETGLDRFAPAELRDPPRSARRGRFARYAAEDPVALATAYGTAVAALRRGAYEVTLAVRHRG